MTRRMITALTALPIALGCRTTDDRGSHAEQLAAGLKFDRTLGHEDNHVYRVDLANGGAILGAVDQHGIDIVIDIRGPDGRQLARLDNASGSQGTEAIEFTAVRSGPYTITIHSVDTAAKPGKYVLAVDAILQAGPNSRRLARASYPVRAVFELWEASLTDPKAVDRFIADRTEKGPLIEAIEGNGSEMQVTYFFMGDIDTEAVELVGGPDYGGLAMKRLGKTNLFFVSQIVPTDAVFVYAFNSTRVHRGGPNGEVEVREDRHSDDAVLEMPRAPARLYDIAKREVPQGKTVRAEIESTFLNERRTISVYTPAGTGEGPPSNLLIVFDGGAYGAVPDPEAVPTQTILDNLIAANKIGPTVAVLIWSMGKRNRDLTGSRPFSDFVADEVVPWARAHYRILPGPKSVVVAGSSFGAFAAAYCAFTHPEAIGSVLSQSGSYWISKSWQTVDADFAHRLYPRETGFLIEAFERNRRLPIRFYLEVGIYDLGAAMLGTNRELRRVLELKGYDVDYREFAGGHNYATWRRTLADGLISLLGRR